MISPLASAFGSLISMPEPLANRICIVPGAGNSTWVMILPLQKAVSRRLSSGFMADLQNPLIGEPPGRHKGAPGIVNRYPLIVCHLVRQVIRSAVSHDVEPEPAYRPAEEDRRGSG